MAERSRALTPVPVTRSRVADSRDDGGEFLLEIPEDPFRSPGEAKRWMSHAASIRSSVA